MMFMKYSWISLCVHVCVCVCVCVCAHVPLHMTESAVYLSTQRTQPRTCHTRQQTISIGHGNCLNNRNITRASSGGAYAMQSHHTVRPPEINAIHYSGA